VSCVSSSGKGVLGRFTRELGHFRVLHYSVLSVVRELIVRTKVILCIMRIRFMC
jgi:hypothetical protein